MDQPRLKSNPISRPPEGRIAWRNPSPCPGTTVSAHATALTSTPSVPCPWSAAARAVSATDCAAILVWPGAPNSSVDRLSAGRPTDSAAVKPQVIGAPPAVGSSCTRLGGRMVSW